MSEENEMFSEEILAQKSERTVENIVDSKGRVIRRRVRTIFPKKSCVVLDDFEACDINRIVPNFLRTGIVTHAAKNGGEFIDNTVLPSFEKIHNDIAHVKRHYDELPAKLKKRFKSYKEMVEFLEDASNEAEAIAIGLIPKPEPEEPLAPKTDEK